MISLNIHMMTSQGRICVQCVTNGLQQNSLWWFTERNTLEKTCIHVLSVRNVFYLWAACVLMWIFIAVNTSAQNVADVVVVVKPWQHTDEVILERNRLNVLFVTNDFQRMEALLDTAEFTVERNHTNVTCVTRHLVGLGLLTVTWESTQETNHTSVHCVTNVSATPATCSDKRCVYSNRRPYHCPYCEKLFTTNTELKCHVRIHTDAKPYSCRHCSDCFRRLAQLERHLLKSHNEGTWFTCDICQQQFITRRELKQHSLRRHEDVKPYVCCECPKRFYTAAELRSHHCLVHSDYWQFCYCRCGKYFIYKGNVVDRLRRCSQNSVFDDILSNLSIQPRSSV